MSNLLNLLCRSFPDIFFPIDSPSFIFCHDDDDDDDDDVQWSVKT